MELHRIKNIFICNKYRMLTKKHGQKMCVNKKILGVQNIYDLIYMKEITGRFETKNATNEQISSYKKYG